MVQSSKQPVPTTFTSAVTRNASKMRYYKVTVRYARKLLIVLGYGAMTAMKGPSK